MRWHKRAYLAAAVMALALTGLVPGTLAQQVKTIRLILPFPPGGPADSMARILAAEIGATGGPNMVVETHPGAATEVGTEYVARSAPDGDTVAVISNSFIVLPNVRKLNYDPLTDFVPICQVANFPPLIVVNAQSPYHTLADLIDAARAKPGAITLATIGPATSSQIAFEMLKQAAKVDMTFVPFNGYTPSIQALLSNTVSSALADYSTLQGQLQTGRLRALVTTSPTRIGALPNVPTAVELGYKDVAADFFGGVVAPAKTPKEKVAKLTDWFRSAIKDPAVIAKFQALGFFPSEACGADFAAIIRNDYDEYGRIIRQAHLQMQ